MPCRPLVLREVIQSTLVPVNVAKSAEPVVDVYLKLPPDRPALFVVAHVPFHARAGGGLLEALDDVEGRGLGGFGVPRLSMEYHSSRWVPPSAADATVPLVQLFIDPPERLCHADTGVGRNQRNSRTVHVGGGD